MTELSRVTISPQGVFKDGQRIAEGSLVEIYRGNVENYPKFFKMDSLCKLGFLAAEFLLGSLDTEKLEDVSIILSNRSGSLVTDRNYQRTIASKDEFFPSPSLFVYTLANIVTGEIAIRHKIYGETAFYIMEQYIPDSMTELCRQAAQTSESSTFVTGWVEYVDETTYLADLRLLEFKKQ